MFYVKSARIQLLEGHSFVVGRKDAQALFGRESDDEPVVLSDFNPTIHPDMAGPVEIPQHAILYIAYTEDHEANRFADEIQEKWREIMDATGVKDDGGQDWYTDGQNTYLGNHKVSEDPRVAELIGQILELEEQLEAHLRGDHHAAQR